MTQQTDEDAAQWMQTATLIHQVGQQMIQKGSPEKCRAAYAVLVPKYQQLIGTAGQEHTDILASCYRILYFVAWRGCTELPSLAPFAEQVAKPFGRFVRKTWDTLDRSDLASREISAEEPKLAYLTNATRFSGANAIAQVTYSLVEGHASIANASQKPPPTVYLLGKADIEFRGALKQIGVDIVDASEITSPALQAEAIINHARDNRIDVLICDEPGAVQTLIFEQRAAPLQALAEMGFAPWGIDGLDICLIGISQDQALLEASCSKRVMTMRAAMRSHVDGPVNKDNVTALRNKLHGLVHDTPTSDERGPTPLVFGFYGRLTKITLSWLQRAEAILKQLDHAVLFIGGTGNTELIAGFLANSSVRARIHVAPIFVNGHEVSSVIDVFLDTDPFPGGISCLECQIKSVPVIWLKNFGNQAIGLISDMRSPNLEAQDDEDYIAKAVALADTKKLQTAGKEALAIAEAACDSTKAARQIEDILCSELRILGAS